MNTLIILVSILGITWLLDKLVAEATTQKIIAVIDLILIIVFVVTFQVHVNVK